MRLLAIQDSFRGVLERRSRGDKGRLTRLQRVLLTAMDRQGPLAMSAVTDFLEVSPATGSQFIRTLELRGLTTRTQDEGDRRRRLVSITPKGREVLAEAHALQREGLERLLEQLSGIEREQLVALATRLATVLDRDAKGFTRPRGGSEC